MAGIKRSKHVIKDWPGPYDKFHYRASYSSRDYRPGKGRSYFLCPKPECNNAPMFPFTTRADIYPSWITISDGRATAQVKGTCGNMIDFSYYPSSYFCEHCKAFYEPYELTIKEIDEWTGHEYTRSWTNTYGLLEVDQRMLAQNDYDNVSSGVACNSAPFCLIRRYEKEGESIRVDEEFHEFFQRYKNKEYKN